MAKRKTGKKTLTRSSKNKKGRKKSSKKGGFRLNFDFLQNISPKYRKDIGAVFLILFAVLMLINGMSLEPIPILKWLSMLTPVFGYGAMILPFLLGAIGVWILLRDNERIASLTLGRFLGGVFVFVNFLILLHAIFSPSDAGTAYLNASIGAGGGYVGAWFLVVLSKGLGTLGMLIVVLAWTVIGLAMLLDRSVAELFLWVGPSILRIQDRWDEYLDVRKTKEIKKRAPVQTHAIETETSVQGQTSKEKVEKPNTPKDEESFDAKEISELEDAPKIEWVLPTIEEMLDKGSDMSVNDDFDKQRGRLIEDTLASLGAPGRVVEINRGPTITQFGVEPDYIHSKKGRTRVRVNKISGLAKDLALALAAGKVRVQAPVPGKGFVGIEVPNEKTNMVVLRDVIETETFKKIDSPLGFGMGQGVAGKAIASDLARMPHLLVAGATNSGKSVFINAMIACMLMNNTPEQLRFVMIDPKRVELTGYNGIPHLLAPVVTDVTRVVGVLQWITREMDNRYQKFRDVGARNITSYNEKLKSEGKAIIPYLVVVIDELADMMMVASDQTEKYLTRMAQLARATGIHLVIATQRPSVDVITGLIKANFPARIAFRVAASVDSRTILDKPGADNLMGNGDMLFVSPDFQDPVRLQGVFVSDNELKLIVNYWRKFAGTTETVGLATASPSASDPFKNSSPKQMAIWNEMKEEDDVDNMYAKAVEIIRRNSKASISMLQRRLKIGYTRAARMIDQMEDDGIIGPPTGNSSARQVLDYVTATDEVFDNLE